MTSPVVPSIESQSPSFADRSLRAELAVLVVHGDLARADDARLAHPAGDDGGMRGRAPARRQDSRGRVHAGDVLRRRLHAHEHDGVALGGHLDGAWRGERDAPARGAGPGRQPLARAAGRP